jgi:hypothetical protein
VDVDLNVDRGPKSDEALATLLARLDAIKDFDAAARTALSRDASEGGEDAPTQLYVEHHRDELPDADLERVFGSKNRDLVDASSVLSKLLLVRVGLYPQNAEYQLLLDYSIGPEITDYLLCVAFDAEGKLHALDLES